MTKWEIPCINNVMITHPFKRVPCDVCPREEIASPSKLLAFSQTNVYDWDPINIFEQQYQRAWIQHRTRYTAISSKIKSHGLYALTQRPDMFMTVLHVNDCSVDDILHWLRHYALTPVIITNPLLSYRTKYQEILYFVTNTFPQRTVHVAPLTDLTHQMMVHNAYTIANGLTLAIAMHRLGVWSSPAFLEALTFWFQETENPYTDITSDIQDLVVQHLIPHICDHPYFYACMGKHKANIHVLRAIHNKYEVYEPFIQQHDQHTQVITSAALQMLPYTPMDLFDYVTSSAVQEEYAVGSGGTRVDIGGLMQSMFTQRGVWKRWKLIYRDTLLRYSQRSSSVDDFIDQCMRRICMIYKRGVHQGGRVKTGRIRAFWQQIMEVLDPKKDRLKRWVHRHIVLQYIRRKMQENGHVNTGWLPNIPVPFLLDLFRSMDGAWKIWEPHPITITSINNNIGDVFPDAIIKLTTVEDQTWYSYSIHKPIAYFMSVAPSHSSSYQFLCILKSIARDKLRFLHSAFLRPLIPHMCENEGYTLWMILHDYFTSHKEKLCL